MSAAEGLPERAGPPSRTPEETGLPFRALETWASPETLVLCPNDKTQNENATVS